MEARTAAYGSAYCIVRLTPAGEVLPSPEASLNDAACPYPVGAGSENAPYASMEGLEAGMAVLEEKPPVPLTGGST